MIWLMHPEIDHVPFDTMLNGSDENDVLGGPLHELEPLARYMDFAKFVSMLTAGGLFLSRLDHLPDPREGRIPDLVWDQPMDVASLAGRCGTEWDSQSTEALRIDDPRGSQVRTKAEEIEADRLKLFVSCWHSAVFWNRGRSDGNLYWSLESMAMWHVYGGSGPALYIETTGGRLLNFLTQHRNVRVGKVTYVDRNAPFRCDSAVRLALRKEKAYDYEREYRILAVRQICQSDVPHRDVVLSRGGIVGLWIRGDVQALITKVVVSPLAPAWFGIMLQQLVRSLGFTMEVAASSLLETPGR